MRKPEPDRGVGGEVPVSGKDLEVMASQVEGDLARQQGELLEAAGWAGVVSRLFRRAGGSEIEVDEVKGSILGGFWRRK